MSAPCTGSDALAAQAGATLAWLISPGGLVMLGVIGIMCCPPLALLLMTLHRQGRR